MLRSRSQHLQLGIGAARRIDQQLATQRKRVGLVRQAQALQLEGGVNGHKNMVALRAHRARG